MTIRRAAGAFALRLVAVAAFVCALAMFAGPSAGAEPCPAPAVAEIAGVAPAAADRLPAERLPTDRLTAALTGDGGGQTGAEDWRQVACSNACRRGCDAAFRSCRGSRAACQRQRSACLRRCGC